MLVHVVDPALRKLQSRSAVDALPALGEQSLILNGWLRVALLPKTGAWVLRPSYKRRKREFTDRRVRRDHMAANSIPFRLDQRP